MRRRSEGRPPVLSLSKDVGVRQAWFDRLTTVMEPAATTASTCKRPIADGIVGTLDGSALQEGRDRIERGQADDGPGERLLHAAAATTTRATRASGTSSSTAVPRITSTNRTNDQV